MLGDLRQQRLAGIRKRRGVGPTDLFDARANGCQAAVVGADPIFGAVQTHAPVAHGWLRASHRQLDKERSLPWRPWHPHLEREPLTPGESYDVEVEIWPTSIVIPPRYTLALTVQGHDYEPPAEVGGLQFQWTPMRGVGPFRHDSPEGRPADVYGGAVTLHTGGPAPAHLLLPVIPQ